MKKSEKINICGIFCKFHLDATFCASAAFTMNGEILSQSETGLISYHCFREHSQKMVYLCGSDKFEAEAKFVAMTLESVDYFISDGNIPTSLKQKYPNTVFLNTK